jgi:hypothetical protein
VRACVRAATCEATRKKVARRSNVSGAVSIARSAPAEGGQGNSKALSSGVAGVAGAVGSEQQSEVDSFFIASSSVDALMSCTSAAAAE